LYEVQRGISAPILAMWRPGTAMVRQPTGHRDLRWRGQCAVMCGAALHCSRRRAVAMMMPLSLSFSLFSSARPFLALESRAARLRYSESFTLSLRCSEVGRYLWRAARGVSEAFESAASETRLQGQTSPASIERTFDFTRFPNSTSGLSS